MRDDVTLISTIVAISDWMFPISNGWIFIYRFGIERVNREVSPALAVKPQPSAIRDRFIFTTLIFTAPA